VKRFHCGLRAEQLLDLSTKPNVTSTGSIEKSRPLFRWVLVDRFQKDRFGLVGQLSHTPRSRSPNSALSTNADLAHRFSHNWREEMQK
jgi:hypothetical protein